MHPIRQALSDAAVTITDHQLQQFIRLMELFREYNESHDLSRLRSDDDIIQRHFVDSTIITAHTDLSFPLVDIGTGAGFPGLPLKILHPQGHIILAEPRAPRVEFMKIIIKELGLEEVEIYPHLVTDKSFFDVRGVITRALESAKETILRTDHFLPEGGRVFLMKGPAASDDLEELPEVMTTRFPLVEDHDYSLPGSPHHRRLLVFEKQDSQQRRLFHIMKDERETIGTPITSDSNKTLKLLKQVAASPGSKKHDQMILPGRKVISEMAAEPVDTTMLIPDGYAESDPAIMEKIMAHHRAGTLLILKKCLFNEIDQQGTGGPLLVLRRPEPDIWDGSPLSHNALIIPFQDPANVGAVVRSALALGIDHFILLKEAATPYHQKALRSSAGAILDAHFMKGPSLQELTRLTGQLPLVTLDGAGTPLWDFSFPQPFLLLPGIEGQGLPDELRKTAVSVPISKDVESLNAAVATGIVLYEWKRRSF